MVVPGRSPASIAACLHQPRSVSAFTPTRCPIRTTAAFSDSSGSSFLASATSRIARSRSSGGYFLGAGMVIILLGNQTLHETRGDSVGGAEVVEAGVPAARVLEAFDPFEHRRGELRP